MKGGSVWEKNILKKDCLVKRKNGSTKKTVCSGGKVYT